MERKTLKVKLYLGQYVDHPYWPELNQVIDIQKKSGVNRCRSEAKREQAIKGYLKKEEMTEAEYEALQKKANRKWHRKNDDDPTSPIIIPRHKIAGALVAAVKNATAAVRGKYNADSFRHTVRISDFETDKIKADELFDRMVKLETTNQRSRQVNEVVNNVTATGTMDVPADTKPDELKRLLNFALDQMGIGSCRKMGFGRGEVVSIEEEK